MIQFSDIQIKFGDFTAIDHLNLEIRQGEFFTFLGPSGCGKTTTLRSLAGFIQPSKGKISVKGEDITYKPIEKRGIGMVFQSYALFPTMTVEENITFGLKENRWDKEKIKKRTAEVADMVNLTDVQLKKNISELSGGQQQRVAIARALALNPEIIVLDEPLSNLDAKLRKSLRTELKKIQKASGTTMIYVTHDQEEALTLSDRIAVFNNGCVEQVGTPREIYYHPNSEFVTTFIGDTNQLSEAMISEMNRENPELNLDSKAHIYVRVENVREGNDLSVSSCNFKAEFESEEFYGITTRKTFRFAGGEIKCVSTRDCGGKTEERSSVLTIRKEDMIIFREG